MQVMSRNSKTCPPDLPIRAHYSAAAAAAALNLTQADGLDIGIKQPTFKIITGL